MKQLTILTLLAVLMFSCGSDNAVEVTTIEKVSPIDSTNKRIDKGIAAMFCGELNGSVIVAAGANFPEIAASEGGVKVFYNDIYSFANGEWRFFGLLSHGAASGNTIETKDALYFIAGATTGGGSLSNVTKVSYSSDNQPQIVAMPELPYGVQQSASVVLDSVIYVMAGLQNEALGIEILAFDLRMSSDSMWHSVGNLPEPMLQPVAAVYNDDIYLWGGYTTYTDSLDGKSIDYGYKFNPKQMEFQKIEGSKLGTQTGANLEVYDGKFYFVGGVNKAIFERALNRRGYLANGIGDKEELEKEELEYMKLDAKGFNFTSQVQIFDPQTATWSYSESSDSYALAGAGLATVGDELLIINGEVKPGVRTNKVWKIKFNKL